MSSPVSAADAQTFTAVTVASSAALLFSLTEGRTEINERQASPMALGSSRLTECSVQISQKHCEIVETFGATGLQST